MKLLMSRAEAVVERVVCNAAWSAARDVRRDMGWGVGWGVGCGVGVGVGVGGVEVDANTFVANWPITLPGGVVLKTISAAPVLGLIAIPIPKDVEATQTKHVKWPVASEKPGLLKL